MHFGGFLANVAGEKRRTIYDCAGSVNLQAARIVQGEDAAASTDASVTAAFDGLGKTFDFFETVFNRLSIDNHGMRLDGYVHYSTQYNNAFWNGRQMVFGDGDGVIFSDFTRSLDVIAHELGHGVTEHMAGLEYHNQPGALNESMSDVFGSMVKQWALKQDAASADWLIGADIFTPEYPGDALRSMKDPGQAYDNAAMGRDPQPGHMKDYRELPDNEDGDWGGVHINSGIPNRAFYLAAIALGGNSWDAAGRIWYEALRQSDARTDFAQFATKTFLHASNTYGPASHEASNVELAWNQVGVEVGLPPGPDARNTQPARAYPV
jgi:Zn-dependent metalloprotease